MADAAALAVARDALGDRDGAECDATPDTVAEAHAEADDNLEPLPMKDAVAAPVTLNVEEATAEKEGAAENVGHEVYDPLRVGYDANGVGEDDTEGLTRALSLPDKVACDAVALTEERDTLARAVADADIDAIDAEVEGEGLPEMLGAAVADMPEDLDTLALARPLRETPTVALTELDTVETADSDKEADGDGEARADTELERDSAALRDAVAVGKGEREVVALFDTADALPESVERAEALMGDESDGDGVEAPDKVIVLLAVAVTDA